MMDGGFDGYIVVKMSKAYFDSKDMQEDILPWLAWRKILDDGIYVTVSFSSCTSVDTKNRIKALGRLCACLCDNYTNILSCL